MNGELKKRMLEPSTWRGVGGLLVAFGLLTPGAAEAVVGFGVALISLVEVVRKEA